MIAVSTFAVTEWTPAPYADEVASEAGGPTLSKATVLKTFTGPIEGTSRAQLLLCQADPNDQSAGAGYIGSERFEGSVDGRSGTFVFHHWGSVGGGAPPVTGGHVVPGTGTGELEGISGTLTIAVDEDGTHTLTLEYTQAG